MVDVKQGQKIIEVFIWSCPGCGKELSFTRPPMDDTEAQCEACERKQREAKKAEWLKQAVELVPFVGGVITAVEVEGNDWGHFRPDLADISSLTVQLYGKWYSLHAESSVICWEKWPGNEQPAIAPDDLTEYDQVGPLGPR